MSKVYLLWTTQSGEQLEEIFRSQHSLWKTSPSLISAERTAQWDESNPNRFPKRVSNSFLTQMVDAPTSGAFLILLLKNEKELVRDMIITINLGCTGNEVLQDPLLLREASGCVQILYFRRANIILFRKLVGGTLWETAMESRGASES